MEKISGILPSSQRLTKVDLSDGPVLRPGTVSFGQPVASNSKETRRSPSSSMVLGGEFQPGVSEADRKNAEMARSLSDRFFLRDEEARGPEYYRALQTELASNRPSEPIGFRMSGAPVNTDTMAEALGVSSESEVDELSIEKI